MIYMSSTATAAEIQAALASDNVTLASAAYYPFVATQGVNASTCLVIPAGRNLDLNGSTLFFAGIIGQTLDTDAAALLAYAAGAVGGTVRGGYLRGPASRLVAGGRPACGNRLIGLSQNGVVFNGLFEDLTLYDAQAQAISILNVNGLTLRRVSTPRPTALPPAGASAGHYIDLDVTANDRLTQAIVVENCDLDSYGQECLKMENVTNIRVRGTRMRNYVTIVQDLVPYSSLSDVEFASDCRFDAWVGLANLRRRSVAGVPDNLGTGNVTIRGRFVGDSALIYGADSTATGDTNANMYANLAAEYCSFEGQNSHCVPVNGSAWITKSSGVKTKLTIYVSPTATPNGIVPSAAVSGVGGNTTLAQALGASLSTANVAAYFLATRGVTVDLGQGTLTGANNLGVSWSTYTGVCPIDFCGRGSTLTFVDAEQAAVGATFSHATNTSKQRVIGVTFKNATNRGWLVNSAVADIEFYDTVSDTCTTANGGGGGRLQVYAAAYLGPGTKAVNCSTTGATNGGGFLISASGTSPVTVEGVRGERCTAGGNGGAIYNQSAYCNIKSAELVNNTSATGAGGLFSTWSVAAVTQSIRNVTFRGNVGAGGNNDCGLICGTATGKISILDCIFASGGTVLTKSGAGDLDYGRSNIGSGALGSITGGANTLIAANQVSDPLFTSSTDTSVVSLQSTSPCKGAAVPNWTVGTNCPTLSFLGEWFNVNASSATTMGARP